MPGRTPADTIAIVKTTSALLAAIDDRSTEPRIVVASLARLTAAAIKATGGNPAEQLALFVQGVRDELRVLDIRIHGQGG